MLITDMIAAYLAALLAGTGVGGGGLFVIYLTSVRNLTQSDAQALNLVFFIAASAAALPYHIRRRKVEWRVAFICILLGCVGTLIGGALRESLPENVLRDIFAIMLIIVGCRSLFRKKRHKKCLFGASDDK